MPLPQMPIPRYIYMMKFPYRADIDGLRAVAVLGVILYHARFSIGSTELFSGGFIGVDIFFVISGYLITLIILRELQAGTFSFLRFYERRARRILPALFLMMLVSAPFAFFLMDPKALKEYAGSSISSLSFVSNIWFWLEDSYTAEPSASKPLLHTWSLSIEEQFYLLYPAALLGLCLFRRYVIAVFVTALFISLLLANYGSQYFASAAFFFLPTRAWELLAGALLAKLELQRTDEASSVAAQSLLALTGLIFILASFLVFDDNMRHPSLLTLLPVAGTMLLIRFGRNPGLAQRLFSSQILVATGLLSYSLYLWHFPVLALARVADVPMNFYNTTLLLLLAAVLALASFHLVEKPARDPAMVPRKEFAFSLGGSLLGLAGIFLLLHAHGSKELRSFQINDTFFDISAESVKRYERAYASCGSGEFYSCAKPTAGRVNILVVGDSMAVDVINILAPLYPDYHFAFSSLGGCPPAPDITTLVGPDHPDLEQCRQLNEARFTDGSLEGFDGVIIDNLMGWFTAEDLRPYLAFLAEEGMHNVFIVGNYLRLTRDFTEIIQELGSVTFSYSTLESTGYLGGAHGSETYLQELAREYGFDFLNVRNFVCSKAECRLFIGNYPFTWDSFHFSVEFAEYLGQAVKPSLADTWLHRLSRK